MKPVIAQAFEAMSKGECPCHKRIQETKPKSSVGIRQAQQQGLVARRGYADPRWPDVPLEYDALVPMHKATVARIAASFPELCSSVLDACELFYLKGQARGQGSMSSLTGCPACKARAMTEYGCLDCGAEIGGRKP